MSNTGSGPLRPGARVGAFVVREEIGFGATSIVYEAEHRTLRHRVAVKVLRSSSDMDSELRLRFEREMKLCTSLSSLHVPHVYEVGELPSGLPYIVMERLSGTTLAEWLAIHRKLPVAVVVEIGIQLCAALTALHERQVLHRDVKPENLVLHRAFHDGYVLKLVDFGICKPLVSDGLSLTRRGTVVGTPEYMSPEQVQGIDADVRTDVYSTGVVLYELLAGCTPFEGRELELLGRAILFASPPRLSSLRPEVSAVLEGIVMRAMSKDRTDRHPSVGALRRELERFAEEQSLRRHPSVWALMPASGARSTPPPPPAAREGQRTTHTTLTVPRIPVRRGAIMAAAAGALAVLLTAGLSVAYYVYDPFAEERLHGGTLVPVVPEPEPPRPFAPTALDLGPLAPDEAPAPPPAATIAPAALASGELAMSEPAPSARVEAPATPSPERASRIEDGSGAETSPAAEPRREARRARSRAHRRAARRRRAALDAEEPRGPSTTVAFAPTAPITQSPVPEIRAAEITAAEIYAQVGASPRPQAPAVPSAPSLPESPYVEAPRAEAPTAEVPPSPYALDDGLELVDPYD